VPTRHALWFIMPGETFDGRRAAEMRLVNEVVPAGRLRARTGEVAAKLAGMNPRVLRAAKVSFKKARLMSWDQAEDYLYAKLDQPCSVTPSRASSRGSASSSTPRPSGPASAPLSGAPPEVGAHDRRRSALRTLPVGVRGRASTKRYEAECGTSGERGPAPAQVAGPAMLTSQLMPNLSTSMPKVSPQGAVFNGSVTVAPSVSASQYRRRVASSSPLRDTEKPAGGV
jgi:hypothetical protein